MHLLKLLLNFSSSWLAFFYLMYFQFRLWLMSNLEAMRTRQSKHDVMWGWIDIWYEWVYYSIPSLSCSSLPLQPWKFFYGTFWVLMKENNKMALNFLSHKVHLQDKNSSVACHTIYLSSKIISVILLVNFAYNHSTRIGILKEFQWLFNININFTTDWIFMHVLKMQRYPELQLYYPPIKAIVRKF